MPIDFKRNIAILRELVSVEEAEVLLSWMQKKSNPKIDFSACKHIHPANLQVLLAGRATVTAWPHDVALAMWLKSLFK